MKSPDKILVINSGSSSLKFTLYSIAQGNRRLANGLVERIGTASANMAYRRDDEPKSERIVSAEDHAAALKLLTECLVDPERGVLASLDEVDAIGHRMLHGGEIFKAATAIDPDVMSKLKALVPLGPLHMPANIGGVEACEKIFPGAPNVAVFDTAFHQTMPDHVSHYAIPNEYYEKYGIRFNCLAPNYVWVPKQEKVWDMYREHFEATTPMPYVGMPEDAAWAVVYLCSDEAKYITATELLVDGGLSARFA